MIIMIHGEKRHGKDTIANYLVNKYNFERYGFADPIRRMCKDIFLWDDDWIDNHKEDIDPRWNLSYRKAAQTIGDELFRQDLGNYIPDFKESIGEDIWVKRFLYLHNPQTNYVISDFRYKNEIDVISSTCDDSIITIEVIKPSAPSGTDPHRSENNLKDFECKYTRYNDSTLKDLFDKVEYILMQESLFHFNEFIFKDDQ